MPKLPPMKNVPGVVGRAAGKLTPAIALAEIGQVVREAVTVRQQEATCRAKIAADRDATLARERRFHDIGNGILANDREAKTRVYDALGPALQSAVDAGNTEAVTALVNGLVTTLDKNPVADIVALERAMQADANDGDRPFVDVG